MDIAALRSERLWCWAVRLARAPATDRTLLYLRLTDTTSSAAGKGLTVPRSPIFLFPRLPCSPNCAISTILDKSGSMKQSQDLFSYPGTYCQLQDIGVSNKLASLLKNVPWSGDDGTGTMGSLVLPQEDVTR